MMLGAAPPAPDPVCAWPAPVPPMAAPACCWMRPRMSPRPPIAPPAACRPASDADCPAELAAPPSWRRRSSRPGTAPPAGAARPPWAAPDWAAPGCIIWPSWPSRSPRPPGPPWAEGAPCDVGCGAAPRTIISIRDLASNIGSLAGWERVGQSGVHVFWRTDDHKASLATKSFRSQRKFALRRRRRCAL